MSSINHLESIDSGSNYRFGNKMEVANLPRSLFDLSHLVTTDIPKEGIVYPLTIIPTNPAEDFDINADCLLRVMPQVVPLYSRMRMYIYGFYSRMTDLWDEADVFITRGYNGNETSLRVPILNDSNVNLYYSTSSSDTSNNTTFLSNTLWDYMGLPQGIQRISSDADLTTSGNKSASSEFTDANINALPFMMYLRIWRDYFINKNHFINDRVILPNDDSRFRLNSNGELLSAKDLSKTLHFVLHSVEPDVSYTPSGSVFEFGLFTHLYPSDYFTSALPFTQRGTPTPLTADLTMSSIASALSVTSSIDFTNSQVSDFSSNAAGIVGYSNNRLGLLYNRKLSDNSPYINEATQISSQDIQPNYEVGDSDIGIGPISGLVTALNRAAITNAVNSTASTIPAALSIYANDIRKLFAEQQELEKMARTDGSLGGFGLTFFGERSKNARDYKPTYIGGTYKNISFTEVLQTSGSSIGTTDPESSSPLGAQAGHGIVGISNGRIGHCHSDDYGYIMLLACIMPDIYYHQGLAKMWTIQRQDELYLPERARLGLVPILNKELYFAGNNSSSSGGDNYLWAYQNPFDEFRYMPNKICGQMANPSSKSFYPYTQARTFTQLPNWGREFSEANDIRDDYLFAPNESHFTAQFQFNIRAVRPIPYKPIPAKLV